MQEFSLSSQEGVALMCLAEALLRIPDAATRDALIRDKIGRGDWRAHLGHSPSLFVNAATWGLLITGKLVATHSETGLSTALTRADRARRRAADPQGRRPRHAPDGRAVRHRRDHRGGAGERRRARGAGLPLLLRHAGRGGDDRRRRRSATCAAYEHAIHAIGKAAGRARHLRRARASRSSSRRCTRATAARSTSASMAELLPRAAGARACSPGATTSASTSTPRRPTGSSSRSTCSRRCASSPSSPAGTASASSSRPTRSAARSCSTALDRPRRAAAGHRLMVRLVKGAYWDSEIKRAQVDGLDGYPVYTRKVHTDVAYLACARKLLAAPDAVFPQFATHNAHTLAAIHEMAGRQLPRRPVRVPVPARHGRAALRGGRRRGQARPPLPHLRAGRHARDAARLPGAPPARERRQHLLRQPHRRPRGPGRRAGRRPGRGGARPSSRSARRIRAIALPRDLYGAERPNSRGLDLANEQRLRRARRRPAGRRRRAAGAPRRCWATATGDRARRATVRNPADHRDVVGAGGRGDAARWSTPRSTQAAAGRAGLGRDRRRPSAPPACCAPPT